MELFIEAYRTANGEDPDTIQDDLHQLALHLTALHTYLHDPTLDEQKRLSDRHVTERNGRCNVIKGLTRFPD